MSDTPKGRFPKSEHLLKHSDFQRVYEQGRRHFSGNMTVFYLHTQQPNKGAGATEGTAPATSLPGPSAASAEPAGVRVGFTVPKALGVAVDRNRMRRRTREAVRRHLELLRGLGGIDLVINPKRSLLGAEFAQIAREVERAFGVIRRGGADGHSTAPRNAAGRRGGGRQGARR